MLSCADLCQKTGKASDTVSSDPPKKFCYKKPRNWTTSPNKLRITADPIVRLSPNERDDCAKQTVQPTRTAERANVRPRNTRRKVLIGAAVLARLADGSYTQAELHALLDTVISRQEDRALFDLPARPDSTPGDPVT